MTGRDKRNDNEIIEELIEAETEAALAQFRVSRFRESLEERIQLASTAPLRSSFFRLIPAAVWVSTAALLLFGGALFTYRFLRAPERKASLTFESYLRQLPGIQAIEKGPQKLSDLVSPPASSFKNAFAAIISNPVAQSGATLIPPEGRGFSTINPDTRPMGLKELFDILIMNKSVERVLMMIYQKTKEG